MCRCIGLRFRLPMLVLLVGCLLGSGALRAQSIVYVDQNATGPVHDGSSWCQAYLDLSEAIEAAADDSTIRVADGTYKPDPTGLEDPRDATFSMRSRLRIEGGYAGCGALDPDVRNIELYETILSGDLADDDTPPIESNCFEIHEGLWCDNAACEEIVCGIVPQCCEYQEPYFDWWGGWCLDVALTECCEQYGHVCENSRHVVVAEETYASAVLDGFTIVRGYARGAWLTPESMGGGILVAEGNPRIFNCSVTDNMSLKQGGGIGVYYGSPRLSGCTMCENQSLTNEGGGIGGYYSTLTLDGCVIKENESYYSGGGLYAIGGTAALTGCTIDNNQARSGAGLAFLSVDQITIEDSTITGNTATGFAGGMKIRYS
ncbi:MAG: right-handed parallel beta-helix repeat-containing protein, partial [Phycisphaerales bacterium]